MHAKSSSVERAASIALRTVHLAAVVALGGTLLGAPLPLAESGLAAAGSGALLFAMELFARRLHALDVAGLAVLVKLAAVASISAWPPTPSHRLAVFWGLLLLSSVSSHAPKTLRHWRPGRAGS
jgi:uncharacterized membrane protein YhaH (DUF805 family)